MAINELLEDYRNKILNYLFDNDEKKLNSWLNNKK